VEVDVIMPRKDGPSRRLAEEIAIAKRIKEAREEAPKKALEETQQMPTSLAGALKLLGESRPYGIAPWGVIAPEFPELDETAAWDRPILNAFKAFDLDPHNLSNWRQLLGHLAYVLFAEPGAPRKWPDQRLCLLLADVAAYKRKNPETSDTAICIWLHKKKKWKNIPSRLRRVLQDARDPARNGKLERIAYDLMTQQMLREAATALGLTPGAPWSETEVKNWKSKVKRLAVGKAIEEADKLWGG
jgi:hypothetical protein